MSLDDIVANDYGQSWVLTVLDTDTDSAADVSSYSSTPQVELKDPDGNVATKTASYVTDGSDGQVTYTIADDDIDETGDWEVRAIVNSGSAVLSSRWKEFRVYKD